MREHEWFADRNKELLGQLEEFRAHAAETEPAWAVSLQILIDEARKAFEAQNGKLKELEDRAESLSAELEGQKKRLEDQFGAERKRLEEKASALSARLGEMETLRDEEGYRVKTAVSFKDAEIERLMHMLRLDPAGKRRKLIQRALLTAVLAAASLFLAFREYQDRVLWRRAETPLPYAHPSAVGFVGGELVVGDWLTQSLYFHRPEPGLPVSRVLPAPKVHVSGLAGDAGRVLAADDWDGKVLTVNVSGGELETIRADASPGPKPSGLFLDKDVLWVADPGDGKLHRRDLEGGSPPMDYALPFKPRGVIRRGGALWVLDERSGKVLRNKPGMDLDKPDAWTAVTEGFPDDGPRPVGMTADDKSLWVLTSRPAKLVRYNLRYLR